MRTKKLNIRLKPVAPSKPNPPARMKIPKLRQLVYDEESEAIHRKTWYLNIVDFVPEIDMFWKIIGRIRCVDKDDGRMSATCIRFNLTDYRLTLAMLDYHFIPKLKAKLTEVPFDRLSEIEQKNFFTHIIAKGKEFYSWVLSSPSICLYILEKNYYPIYQWILQKRPT